MRKDSTGIDPKILEKLALNPQDVSVRWSHRRTVDGRIGRLRGDHRYGDARDSDAERVQRSESDAERVQRSECASSPTSRVGLALYFLQLLPFLLTILNDHLISPSENGENRRRGPTKSAFQLHSPREFGLMCDCVATRTGQTRTLAAWRQHFGLPIRTKQLSN